MGDEMTTTRMPYDKQDPETGKFEATYAPEDFIEVLREAGSGLTTQEVRERVGCAYRTAHARLTDLEADGRVQSRDVGRAKLWLATDAERPEAPA